MKMLRIVVLLVIGLMAGYYVGIQRVKAQQSCPPPLTCDLGTCRAYDAFCDTSCYPPYGGYCQWWVGRCWWEDGPICSYRNCLPQDYCF